MKGLLLTIAILLINHAAEAQGEKRRNFDFLNVPGDTRLVALGGINVSLFDEDVNMFFSNPGALSPTMQGHLSLNHAFYYGGINVSKIAYVSSFKKSGTWGAGIQNMSYGKMDAYDPSGNPIGEISANDFMGVGSYGYKAGNFNIGLNAKLAYSHMAGYHAVAVLMDIGGIFSHPELDWKTGMNIKNAGIILSDYTPSSGSKLPFDVQIGTSFKPTYMPVRFSITAYNLYKGNILYHDPGSDLFGEEPGLFKKVFSHFTFGGEFLLTKNFNFRAGYNYLIRRELRLEQKSGGAGFSYGFMLKIKSFEVSYSRAVYHVAGGINYIGITSNLKTLYKRVN